MKLKPLITGFFILTFTACGSSNNGGGGGGGANNTIPPDDANTIQRPTGNEITVNDLDAMMSNNRNALRIEKGMHSSYEMISKMKIPNQECTTRIHLTQVVLQSDRKNYYTFETFEETGGISSTRDGKITCNNEQKITHEVRQEKTPRSFNEMIKTSSDLHTQTTYYLVNGKIQVHTTQDFPGGTMTDLFTFENPAQTPFFLGMIEFKSIAKGSINNDPNMQYSAKTLGKRESAGENFRLDTLREKLRDIRFCDNTDSASTCNNHADLRYLLNR